MQQERSAILASIDIGSNTIHLLVARCSRDKLDILETKTELVRIEESVTKTGEISQDKCDTVLDTLQRYQKLAKQHDAEQVLAVATEAMRKARNGNELLQQVQENTGLQVHLISGNIEAALTFYGATYGEDVPSKVGVLDVGGGSTELIAARKGHITWLVSIPIGSGKLRDEYLPSNPPRQSELEDAQKFLHNYLQDLNIKEQIPTLFVTGSSATSLLELGQKAFEWDEQSKCLTRDGLLHCQGLLEGLPAEEIAERYEQEIERARVLPAGALILLAAMDRLKLNEVGVSENGLRHGVLLAYARYGEHWLDSPEVNVDASRQGKAPDEQEVTGQSNAHEETFAQTGQHLLKKSGKKFLRWRDKILNQGDAEAVHKMRVASRRLRATLDAYEGCAKTKVFKKVYRQVKQLADELGSERDSDVMILGLHTRLEQAPSEEQEGIQWFIDHLDRYHKQCQKNLDASLEGLDVEELKQEIKKSIPKGALQNGKG
jgi:exopolyphosphatase/pppGpp-phosphohydrolase